MIRHGETAWSLSGAHTGRTDIPLTDRGRLCAAALKRYFAGKQFAAVLTSPMQRARETCAIAGYGETALIDEGLLEWNYGIYEGKTTDEIRASRPDWSVWKDEIIGGESLEQVGERADGVLSRALALVPHDTGGAVALFAHAHILRIIAARWIGLTAEGGSLLALETGSVSVLG
ncbi:MAG: histidine phosphatase family protein, partial [Granulicella sp.]